MFRITENIKEKAYCYRQELISFLRELISIPSFSGQEREIVARVRKEMENVFDEVYVDRFGTVIGRIGQGSKKLLYDSHLDTVGIGDKNAWDFDPFKGKFENGIIYGRGACDNKAAIAAMIYGTKIARELNLDFDCKLYVAGVVQEEDCEGLAVSSLLEELKPDYVVLGECTNLGINRGHRGHLELEVITKGKACHASVPESGINAIYQMIPIIDGIRKLKLGTDPFLGKGSIAVTKIECTSASTNVIPDECRAHIDRRLTLNETKEKAVNELKNLGDVEIKVLEYEQSSYTGYQRKTEKYFPAWALPEEHLFVQRGVETCKALFDKLPVVGKWDFSTDGAYTMGVAKVPTIGFGPGEEKYAHTTQDQVRAEDLVKSAWFYALFPKMLE